jgi:hypothetical protein
VLHAPAVRAQLTLCHCQHVLGGAFTLDTALIMAADTISGYIQGLLDGIEFKQTAYALDRDSRKAALARFLKRASGSDQEAAEEGRLAA